jgi:hypothetical protein
MFGKSILQGEANTSIVGAVFQSPCAGNMFGKKLMEAYNVSPKDIEYYLEVSIPVCGEHVW